MSSSGTPSSESPPASVLALDAAAATTPTASAPAPVEPTGPPASPSTVIANHKKKDTSKKVVVYFRAIGSVPIMKQNIYTITASNKFSTVIQFLRTQINYRPSDPLFLYINSAFAPSPDEIVNNLFKCFNTNGKLIVNYCASPAWG